MSCADCDDQGHLDGDCIWVDGKAFCPVTHERIFTEEEAEEMSDEELKKAQQEQIKLVKEGTPEKWVVVKESV